MQRISPSGDAKRLVMQDVLPLKLSVRAILKTHLLAFRARPLQSHEWGDLRFKIVTKSSRLMTLGYNYLKS
jgi:hypothetical protein